MFIHGNTEHLTKASMVLGSPSPFGPCNPPALVWEAYDRLKIADDKIKKKIAENLKSVDNRKLNEKEQKKYDKALKRREKDIELVEGFKEAHCAIGVRPEDAARVNSSESDADS